MRRVWILFALLLLAGSARAEDKAKAREAFRVGTQHFKLGEYDQALDSFKEAYRNFESPVFLYNIAQCERQLDHKQEAIRFYRQYLADAKDAPNRDEVQAIITKLQSALDEQRAAGAKPPQAPMEAAPTTPPPATTTNAATLTATAPPPEKTPVYKKWWLWTAVGVVAVGIGVGLGVGLGTSSSGSLPSTTFGAAKPF